MAKYLSTRYHIILNSNNRHAKFQQCQKKEESFLWSSIVATLKVAKAGAKAASMFKIITPNHSRYSLSNCPLLNANEKKTLPQITPSLNSTNRDDQLPLRPSSTEHGPRFSYLILLQYPSPSSDSHSEISLQNTQ